ncbi:Uncharacterised protein [Morganella morganii]|nr:Uncharacterised protein [Morganella morganii]
MNNRLFKKVMAACAVGAIAGALVLIPAYEGVEYKLTVMWLGCSPYVMAIQVVIFSPASCIRMLNVRRCCITT